MNVPKNKCADKRPDYFEDDEAGLTDQLEQEGIALTPEAKRDDEVGD